MRIGSRLVLAAAVSAVAATVWATDRTWVGGQSDVWSLPGNWDPNTAAPGGSDYALIPALAPVPVVLHDPTVYASTAVGNLDMAEGSHLMIQSGAAFVITSQARGALAGTITVTNGSLNLDSGYPMSGGTPWTVGGIVEFGTAGNFAGPTGTYNNSRTLINNGTIRSIDSGIVYSTFSKVSGGTLDGAWYGRTTIQNLLQNPLTLSNVTLESNFSLVADSSHKAKTTLLDSVTNNSANVAMPASGNGTMVLGVSSGNSTFNFNGSGAVTLSGQSLGGTGVTTLNNNASHTLRGDGTISPGTLNNAGTIQATGGTAGAEKTLNVGTLNNQGSTFVDRYNTLVASGAVTNSAGSTLNVNGTLNAPSVSVAGTLMGSGIINSTVTLEDGSTFAPGNSPGTITIANLVVVDDVHWDFDAGDQVVVTDTIDFTSAPVMTVHVADGTPSGTYPLLVANNVVGTPTFIIIGAHQGEVVQSDGTFMITVPEPGLLSILAGASVLTLVRKRRR